jgi:hypothetical protein
VAVPVSLVGTFGDVPGRVLAEQPVADGADHRHGLVVDDAIVVLENISRHIEERHEAAGRRLAARARGFTVLSMSLSLIAVFIPLLLMGGIVGRLFRSSRSRCRSPSWCRWSCR